MSDVTLIRGKVPITGQVEICRSFAYKMNVGNYESRDFFASYKVQCDAADSEIVSEGCYEFCKSEVLASVASYLREKRRQEEKGKTA